MGTLLGAGMAVDEGTLSGAGMAGQEKDEEGGGEVRAPDIGEERPRDGAAAAGTAPFGTALVPSGWNKLPCSVYVLESWEKRGGLEGEGGRVEGGERVVMVLD
jgi:hypothetical protein